jgi:hypothetical protein
MTPDRVNLVFRILAAGITSGVMQEKILALCRERPHLEGTDITDAEAEEVLDMTLRQVIERVKEMDRDRPS